MRQFNDQKQTLLIREDSVLPGCCVSSEAAGVRALSGPCSGEISISGARQLGSSGHRSGWDPAVSMTLSEDVGLTGPPEDLRQDEGPLQHPASVGSSAETLSPGKAGLGAAAPPTS